MKITEGDYVITKKEGPTAPNLLVKVTDAGDKDLSGLVEKTRQGSNCESSTFSRKQVLLNLGPKPQAGKVYGIDLGTIYRKTLHHDGWGDIHVHAALDKLHLSLLKRSLDSTVQTVNKLGLTSFVDLFETKIHPKNGKWAGYYKHGSKDKPNLVVYAPECAQNSLMEMNYIVLHEFGHVIRHNGVTGKKIKASWVKLFNTSIAPQVITKSLLQSILRESLEEINGERSFSQVLKSFSDADEEKAIATKALFKWFNQVHHLGARELGILWDNYDEDSIKKLWPKDSIDTSKLAPTISEYACKNFEETFAEAFAFYALKKKLPANVLSLLERSLQYAKATVGKDAAN